MGDFVTDTALEGGDGRYRIVLSEDWEAPFGPLGGYVAAIALRAMGVESPLSRPVSIHCQFLAVAAYQEMDVEVVTLRRGKRSHALQVRMLQEGRLIHAASGWVAEEGMSGGAPGEQRLGQAQLDDADQEEQKTDRHRAGDARQSNLQRRRKSCDQEEGEEACHVRASPMREAVHQHEQAGRIDES